MLEDHYVMLTERYVLFSDHFVILTEHHFVNLVSFPKCSVKKNLIFIFPISFCPIFTVLCQFVITLCPFIMLRSHSVEI